MPVVNSVIGASAGYEKDTGGEIALHNEVMSNYREQALSAIYRHTAIH